LIDPRVFHLGVNRLRELGFGEANNLRAFYAKECVELGRSIFLDDGVVREIGEDFRATAFGEVGGDEHEMQFAFAAAERVAADQQNARL